MGLLRWVRSWFYGGSDEWPVVNVELRDDGAVCVSRLRPDGKEFVTELLTEDS